MLMFPFCPVTKCGTPPALTAIHQDILVYKKKPPDPGGWNIRALTTEREYYSYQTPVNTMPPELIDPHLCLKMTFQ